MKYNLQLTLLALIFSTQLLSQTETCLQNQNDTNNRSVAQVIGSDTISREYSLYVPQNYNGSTPTSLIINLHGFGDCASDYAESIGQFYNFNELADEENIIVAYPQGAYRPEKDDTYWEPGDNGEENIYENDVYFIDQLIVELSKEFNINPEMIYACGYSNGGMMAYSLACNRSDLFAAIGIMSGTMLQENCILEKAVPIIKFHGIDDGVLPYNGNLWYQSVQEVVNFWLTQNNISSNTINSSQLNGGKVTLDEYSGGDNNSCLKLYTINEEYDKPGGHVWFSDLIEGASPNSILWDFFKENCGVVTSTAPTPDESFQLFPNPFSDHIQVNGAVDLDYQIFDISGKLILNGKIISDSETIDLATLDNGYYTVRIGRQIEKLIKVNYE